MPVDVGIYGGMLGQPRNALDYANEYARGDALRGQNALQALQLQQSTQANAGNMGVRNALAGMGPQSTVDDQINTLRHLGTPEALSQAEKLDTANQNRIKIGADAAQANANAGKTTQETGFAKRDKALTDIASFDSPQQALASLQAHAAAGDIDPIKAQAIAQSLQQVGDPGTFAQWQVRMLKGILSAPEAVKYSTPDANSVLQANTSTANNAANNATSRANTAATQAGENARAAQSRATQLKIGGYDEHGNMAGGDGSLSGIVDAMGQYKVPESVALSRIPAGLKAQALQQLQQKYPDYDPSTYGARQKAARDFSTGTQGNAMRSFAVAGQHLDQLNSLVDALGNGDNQTLNKIGNAVATWNGATPVTNFDAAKDVVSKEVVKAIVAGGGGVSEREELSKLMSNAKSPQQLKGVIAQYRGLMSAQHDALHAQRLGAGLPDSTMPNYGEAGATGQAAGSGWKILGVH